MNIDIVSKKDLLEFKEELLQEIKKILNYQPQQPLYLKSKELIEMFRISNTKLFELRRNGKIPFKKIGGTYLYALEEVKKALNK